MGNIEYDREKRKGDGIAVVRTYLMAIIARDERSRLFLAFPKRHGIYSVQSSYMSLQKRMRPEGSPDFPILRQTSLLCSLFPF